MSNAAGTTPVVGTTEPLRFKEVAAASGGDPLALGMTLLGVLVVMGLALAFARRQGWLAKYLPVARDARLKVVETRRTASGLALSLVEADGTRYLVVDAPRPVAVHALPSRSGTETQA